MMRYCKWIGRFFFLCLLLSMLIISANAADFAGGSGTESNPYLISTKEHLNNVRNNLKAHYKLVADISFTASDFSASGKFYNGGAGWEPIGTSSKFKGTFDGNGHTISGLYQRITSAEYAGLFCDIEYATVKNLGLLNLDISISGETKYSLYIGGLAGAGNNSTVQNCYSAGKITASSSSKRLYAGGIIGCSRSNNISGCYNLSTVFANSSNEWACVGGIAGEGKVDTITDCYNNGKITGGFAGGIVGNATGSGTVSGCYNTASITGSNSSMCQTGGIAGSSGFKISDCYNTGSVTANGSASALSGGIAGQNTSTVERCYNLGTVTARYPGSSGISTACAGGVVGYLTGNILKSYNVGTVTASATSTSTAYIGGIAGHIYGSNAGSPTVKNCYNTGAVKETASSAAKNSYVGGIAGHASNTGTYSRRTTVSSCYTVGTVTGTTAKAAVGAVVGCVGGYTDVLKCYYLDTFDVGIASGTGKTTKCTSAQMKQKSTFTDLDFASVWTMEGNADYLYPELRDVPMIYTKTVTSVRLTSQPSKLVYEEGEELDVTGGKLMVTYSNGTSKTVTMTAAMVTGFDSSVIGKQTLTVLYEGFRFTFAIEIEAKPTICIDSISEDTAQLTVAYNEEGMCFVAVYDSEGRMLSCGTATVTVNAGEVTVPLLPFALDPECTAKAFLVDLHYAPVCQCAIYP